MERVRGVVVGRPNGSGRGTICRCNEYLTMYRDIYVHVECICTWTYMYMYIGVSIHCT